MIAAFSGRPASQGVAGVARVRSSASRAQTRVPPVAIRSRPQRSLSVCTMLSPKPPSPSPTRDVPDGAGAAGILDFQAHHAAGDLDPEDEVRVRRRAAVAHAVGHQLGREQPRLLEHRGCDVTAQFPRDDRAGGRGSLDVGRESLLGHMDALRKGAPAAHPVVVGAEVGVLGLERGGPGAQGGDGLAEGVDHGRLAPAPRPQGVQLGRRAVALRHDRRAAVRRSVSPGIHDGTSSDPSSRAGRARGAFSAVGAEDQPERLEARCSARSRGGEGKAPLHEQPTPAHNARTMRHRRPRASGSSV